MRNTIIYCESISCIWSFDRFCPKKTALHPRMAVLKSMFAGIKEEARILVFRIEREAGSP